MKHNYLKALEELTGMLDIIDLFIEPDPESDYETGANDALIMVRSYVNRRIDRIEREVIK